MSETRFTVGPWHVASNSNERRVIVERADGQRIASAFFRGDVPEWVDIAEANAALIAAAPDLYEALRAIVALDDGDDPGLWPHTEMFNRARAALERCPPHARPERVTDTGEQPT